MRYLENRFPQLYITLASDMLSGGEHMMDHMRDAAEALPIQAVLILHRIHKSIRKG